MARGECAHRGDAGFRRLQAAQLQTNQSRRNSPDGIELRKFCHWCGKRTAHKETR